MVFSKVFLLLETFTSKKKDFNHAIIVSKYKQLQKEYPNEDPRILLKHLFSEVKTDFVEIKTDFSSIKSFTMDSLVEFYDYLKLQKDLVEDAYGTKIGSGETSVEKVKGRLEGKEAALQMLQQLQEGLKTNLPNVEQLKKEIGDIGQKPPSFSLPEGFQEYPMTPVQSSFIKGAGAYKISIFILKLFSL